MKNDYPCEVCGNNDYIAGVASSVLGPCSFNYCQICLAMRADPKGWIEAAVECAGGIDNINPSFSLIYYDKEDDSYKDLRTKDTVPIKTKGDLSFSTRSQFIFHLKEKGE